MRLSQGRLDKESVFSTCSATKTITKMRIYALAVGRAGAPEMGGCAPGVYVVAADFADLVGIPELMEDNGGIPVSVAAGMEVAVGAAAATEALLEDVGATARPAGVCRLPRCFGLRASPLATMASWRAETTASRLCAFIIYYCEW